jgi:hypothetical protein
MLIVPSEKLALVNTGFPGLLGATPIFNVALAKVKLWKILFIA